MINLIICVLVLIWWVYRMYNNKFDLLTYTLGFIFGAFFTQTIIWLCGLPTVIDTLFK